MAEKKEDKATEKKAPEEAKSRAHKPKGDLHTRLARVLAKIERIPKDGHNDFHNYDYVKEDTLTEQIRPMLAEEGISLIFGAEEVVLAENCITLVRCTFTLGCEHNEPITTTVWGAGRDADRNNNRGDKGVYKAMTGATKYFLYKTFLVSTGDDVEIDTSDQPQQMTPGQRKELEKFRGDPKLNAEVIKWIGKMLDEGGSQTACARIIGEAKKQARAFEAKQKKELDDEKEKNEPDPGQQPSEEAAAAPEKEQPMSDDDIPF